MRRFLPFLFVALFAVVTMPRADTILIKHRATTTTTAASTTTTTLLSGDWTDDVMAWWNLDSATTATNESCSGSCAITAGSGSFTHDTTDKIQGSGALDAPGGSAYMQCTSTNCASVQFTDSFTFCFWVYYDAWASGRQIWNNSSGNNGYYVQTQTDFAYKFSVGNGSARVDAYGAEQTNISTGVWEHVCGVFSNSGDTIQVFNRRSTNINNSGSTVSFTGTPGAGGDTNVMFEQDANLDEPFVDNMAWSAASQCKACSCGLDGTGCECDSDPTAFKTTGRKATNCGDCSLTGIDCNQASPE